MIITLSGLLKDFSLTGLFHGRLVLSHSQQEYSYQGLVSPEFHDLERCFPTSLGHSVHICFSLVYTHYSGTEQGTTIFQSKDDSSGPKDAHTAVISRSSKSSNNITKRTSHTLESSQ